MYRHHIYGATFHGYKVIEDNRFFNNGDLSLHINDFAQSCPEDNPAEML